MVMAARDLQSIRYQETEALLMEWGRVCRRDAERLGLPVQSTIQTIIDHVRRRDAKSRKGRRSGPLTAQGKQKRVFKAPTININSSVMSVDAAVCQLPRWAKRVIILSYRYGLPDRVAAEQVTLPMPREEYTLRREAAVEKVADRLEQKFASAFKML